MKIDVIIPVYRPTEKLNKVLYGLSRQTYLPERIILLHTRDGIKLDVSACKDRVSVTEIPIPEKNLIMEEPEIWGFGCRMQILWS